MADRGRIGAAIVRAAEEPQPGWAGAGTLRSAQHVAAWLGGPLLRHSSLLFLATLVGQALGFVVQIVLARRIGIESYGLYAYAFTWISLLSLLAVLGADRALVRFVGEYRARGEPVLLRGVLAWSVLTSLAASVLVAAAYALLRAGLSPPATAEEAGVLRWSLLAVPLLTLATLVESALRGAEAHAAATWPGRVLRPLLLVLLVLLLTREGGGGGQDARWAVALNVLAILLALLPCLVALWPLVPPRASPPAQAAAAGRPPLPWRTWLAVSAVLGVNTLALYLNGQIDMLVLGMFADQRALGTYGAVTRIVTVVGIASVAVVAVIQPMIVAAHARGGDGLAPLVRQGARLVLLASGGAGAIVLLVPGELLAIFGEPFREGATALRLLAAGQVAAALVSLAGPLLAMTGHERDATSIMVLGALANLVLNLLLVPRFGIEGAALATALSTGLWSLGLLLVAWRRLGILALPVRLRRAG